MVTWVKNKLAYKSFQRKSCEPWSSRATPTLRFQTPMAISIARISLLCYRTRPITLSSITIRIRRRYRWSLALMWGHQQMVTVLFSLKTEPLHRLTRISISVLPLTLSHQMIPRPRTYHQSSAINNCSRRWSSRRQWIVMRTWSAYKQELMEQEHSITSRPRQSQTLHSKMSCRLSLIQPPHHPHKWTIRTC